MRIGRYLYLHCILELLQVFDVLRMFFTAYQNRHGVLITELTQVIRNRLYHMRTELQLYEYF